LARIVIAFLALGAALVIPGLVAPWYGWFAEPGPAKLFEVRRGASLNSVAVDLKRAGLVDSVGQFRILARVLGGDRAIQAGRYRLAPGQPWADMLAAMQQGQIEQLAVTIPEGWPAVQVAERLNAAPELAGTVAPPPEGSVLPDTYAYQAGEQRSAVLARMQAAMAATLARHWPQRSARAAVASPEQAVILASIVEKETGKASERRTIAGVYSNRLRIGMKLDADPTVIYPITRGRPLGRRIRQSELRRDTGYNTYLKPGLPKGPIANPGRASILAVLDPADTDALYFVADGSGGHVFAATLGDHNRNRERWYALRRQRGEM
jgi:UPF0755 protein